MIPHKLEVKNFLSYGSVAQTIDFKNYSLICLSGKNGNGKSALLDAITWAVWGQARKVTGSSKPDEGLLRLGQTSMMVSLEFEVNKQRYRVHREFVKSHSKNHAVVDFELFNEAENRFVSLTDKTIRETQEKIISCIGLDFETFINTAFVRQGHSNEFSQKNPKERKAILASILGLSRFDRLKEQAQEKIKKLQEKNGIIEALQQARQSEFEKQNSYAEERAACEKQLVDLQKSIEEHNSSIHELEQKRNLFLSRDSLFLEAQRLCEEKKEFYKKKLDEMHALHSEWKTVHARLLKAAQPEQLEQALNAARTESAKYMALYEQSLKIQEAIVGAKEKYHTCTRAVQEQFASTLRKDKEELVQIKNDQALQQLLIVKEEEQQKKLLNKQELLKRDLLEIEKKLSSYDAFQKKAAEQFARFEKRRDAYHRFVQYGNRIVSELKEAESRRALFEHSDAPSCPTCEQVVTLRRKTFLLERFSSRESLLHHQELRLRRVLGSLKALVLQDHEQKNLLKKEEESYQIFISKKDSLFKTLQEIEGEFAERVKLLQTNHERKMVLERSILALETSLKGRELEFEKSYLQNELIVASKKQLDELEVARAAISYSQETHQLLKNKVAVLEKEYSFFKDRDKEVAIQNARHQRIIEYIHLLKSIKREIAQFYIKAEQHVVLRKEHEGDEKKRQEIVTIQLQRREQKERLLQEKAKIEHEIARLDSLKKEHEQNELVVQSAKKEMQEYAMLSSLFGKDGIQAVLIEEALPEIEQEANLLLSRLSDNNAQISIDSVRDLKKGGVKETLDIKISDVSGIRPYELFSGGEAFRIDFALRIAISKLLARRAGTSLQTLIIDEGFGSQDDEGLSRLMDAIYTIQDDFERVIIVSHLPIFKDNFPVHFIVEKSPLGSHVHVVERG